MEYQVVYSERVGDRPPVKVGDKWNKLTILEESGKDNHQHRMVFCECECGNRVRTQAANVRLGRVRSCGCVHKQLSAERLRKIASGRTANPEDVARYYIFTNYRKRAAKYSIEFSITWEQFRNLTGLPCSYCKRAPYQVAFPKPSYKVTYTGIDRIDSSKGYTPENSVPCCKICNFAKGTMSTEDFKQWVREIYHNWASQ